MAKVSDKCNQYLVFDHTAHIVGHSIQQECVSYWSFTGCEYCEFESCKVVHHIAGIIPIEELMKFVLTQQNAVAVQRGRQMLQIALDTRRR